MVSGEHRPLNIRRRPLAAFAVTALLVWWLAQRDGVFYVVGVDGPASGLFGALLSAMCAGATVAIALSLLEAASTPRTGMIGAIAILIMPSFIPLHRASLHGPPLLALLLFMVATMVHAPRFSFAYGGAAAMAAVFVSPFAVGLPVAAAGWAFIQARRRGKRSGRRVLLALAPLVAAIAVAHWTGSDAWTAPLSVGWRGGFDSASRAAGHVIGDQLAPGTSPGGLRWFVIADATLIAIALVAIAWRRVVMHLPAGRASRRLFEAGSLLIAAFAAGIAVHTMTDPGAPDPGRAEVFPLAVLGVMMIVLSVALLWHRWPRVGKLAALVLAVGWAGAAVVLT